MSALPTIGRERWESWVAAADALLVDGGEAIYLSRWMRESGLADLLPSLADTVWVGVSAGSMVMTPRIGKQFVEWDVEGSDEALGLVDFSIFPHLDYPGWDSNSSDSAARWAAEIEGHSFAIDDHTALAIQESEVRVVSEGKWLELNA